MASKPWAYLLIKPDGDGALESMSTKSEILSQRHRIGRSPNCETVLEGYNIVSAEHCFIATDFTMIPVPQRSPGSANFFYLKATLEDTSTNGTIVNGEFLKKGERRELSEGTRIEMKRKKVPVFLEFHRVPLSEQEILAMKNSATAAAHSKTLVTPSSASNKVLQTTPSSSVGLGRTVQPDVSNGVESFHSRRFAPIADIAMQSVSPSPSPEHKARIAELTKDLQMRQEQLASEQEKSKDLETKLDQLMRTLKQKDVELLQEKEKLVGLDKAVAKSITEKSNLRYEIALLQADRESGRSDLELKVRNLTTDVALLREQCDNAQNAKHIALKELEEERGLHREKLSNLAEEITGYERKISMLEWNLEDTKAGASREAAQVEQERAAHREKVTSLTQSTEKLKEDYDVTSRALKVAQNRLLELERANAALEGDLHKVRLEYDDQITRHDSALHAWTMEKADLVAKLEAKRSEYDAMVEGYQAQTEMAASYKKDMRKLEQDFDEERREREQSELTMKRELDHSKQNIQSLRSELESEMERNATRMNNIDDAANKIAFIVRHGLIQNLEHIKALCHGSDESSPSKTQVASPLVATDPEATESSKKKRHRATPNHSNSGISKRLHVISSDEEDEDGEEGEEANNIVPKHHDFPKQRSETVEDRDDEGPEGQPGGVNSDLNATTQVVDLNSSDEDDDAMTLPEDALSQPSTIQPHQGSSQGRATQISSHQRIPSASVFDAMD